MTFNFTVQKRKAGEVAALRSEGKLPGVLYGPGTTPVSLVCDYQAFLKLYREAGESSLIDLIVDNGKPTKVLIQDLQHDPVKGVITHVDFRQIDMNKEMSATCELHFVGEAAAVKELGGTLIKAHDTLDIRCLPKDLVHKIEVDLSVLKTFADIIHVKDLILPPGITAAEAPEQVIAKVAAPLTEEQLKAMEEEGKKGVESVEVVEKEKKEEEGEEATPAEEKKSAQGGSASGGKE
jgi:large subunit ribosomal protein L25